jgi:hypothetical protein
MVRAVFRALVFAAAIGEELTGQSGPVLVTARWEFVPGATR